MPSVPPEVLLPLGVGAAVLVAVLLVVLLARRARRRRQADATSAALTAPSPPAGGSPDDESPPDGSLPVAGPASGTVAPEPVWREPAAGEAGPERTVAGAVERALAAREAHTGTRGDARDRLLAVLLTDPVRAVGAAAELEASRHQLDRLADAVRHERAALGDALGRLSAAGLDDRQLARLAGLPEDELRLLLPDTANR